MSIYDLESDDWEMNAIFMHHNKGPCVYVDAYAETISIIFKKIFEKNEQIDLLVYPLLFIVRHYFEIQIKYILDLDNVKYDKNHKLQELWKQAKKVISNRWPATEDPNAFIEINEIINELVANDSDGTAFRYATTKKDIIQLKDKKGINLRSFYEKLFPIIGFLEGVTAGMEEQKKHNLLND
jgi:hypothetical protein